MSAEAGSAQLVRPIGFRPREISSLFNTAVIEQHASAAAFLWLKRDGAVRSPHYKLKHLAALDERVSAHLQGLRVAGEMGWRAVLATLAKANPGSVFVASYLAFASGDIPKMRHALHLGLSQDSFRRALEGGLVWAELVEVRPGLESLQRSANPEHQALALGVLAAHDVDCGDFLGRALKSTDPVLRVRALEVVGRSRRRDLSDAVRSQLGDVDPSCQFWAAWALALVGHSEGTALAFELGTHNYETRTYAIDVAMRLGDPEWARQHIRSLASRAETLRIAIQAAGALGDPAVVPWLLRQMLDPRTARVAAEAVSTITGADLHFLGLKQDPAEPAPESDAAPEEEVEDQDLPWPNPGRLTQWWQEQQSQYVAGQRYLAGHRISAEGSLEVLRQGYQRQRRASAIELVASSDTAPLFSVVDRADRQQRRLAA